MDFEREERELKDIETKILKIRGSQQDLNTLSKAGADRKRILRLLALAPFDHQQAWRRLVKQKRNELRSLARQLRNITDRAERMAEDPLYGAQFWLALLGMMKSEEVQWPAKSDSRAPFGKMMRILANHEENKAKILGSVLRQGAIHSRTGAIVALCLYIRKSTKRNYDDVVARLLTDAYETIEVKKEFSGDQLKKLRKRHMRPFS